MGKITNYMGKAKFSRAKIRGWEMIGWFHCQSFFFLHVHTQSSGAGTQLRGRCTEYRTQAQVP